MYRFGAVTALPCFPNFAILADRDNPTIIASIPSETRGNRLTNLDRLGLIALVSLPYLSKLVIIARKVRIVILPPHMNPSRGVEIHVFLATMGSLDTLVGRVSVVSQVCLVSQFSLVSIVSLCFLAILVILVILVSLVCVWSIVSLERLGSLVILVSLPREVSQVSLVLLAILVILVILVVGYGNPKF